MVSQKPIYRVAVLIFPSGDILDYAGPIEILSHGLYNRNPENPDPIFTLDTVARDGLSAVTTGHGFLTIQPTKSVAQVLDDIDDYDALIVPGASPNIIKQILSQEGCQEVALVKAFFESTKRTGTARRQERVLMSVCTGAFLLQAAGCLSGVEATTHHRALDSLDAVCNGGVNGTAGADQKTSGRAGTRVIREKRFVDAGVVHPGLRLITSGGISSGLDASLHLVELFTDRETSAFIGRVMEYDRRQK